MMRDVSGLVAEQAEAVNAVEEHVDDSLAAVQAGNSELTKAAAFQRSYRKKCFIFGLCIVILIGVIVIPLVIHFLPSLTKANSSSGGGGAPSGTPQALAHPRSLQGAAGDAARGSTSGGGLSHGPGLVEGGRSLERASAW